MKTLMMAGAAALAMATLPVAASAQQATTATTADKRPMTAEQKAMYDGWTVAQRTTYDAWPMNAQTYYWTLDDMQRNVWWNSLDDAQRVQIVGMNANQRTAAWTSIRNQVNSANNATSSSASTTATSNMNSRNSGTVTFRRNEMVQTAPAPHTGEYPPCRGNMQDNCINPREAGLNYGNRPLNYWPGQTASSMDD